MLADLRRFYRNAAGDAAGLGSATLDDYLADNKYGAALRDDHLYPMGAAIWSTPAGEIGRYPAASFIRFCDNHGLLQVSGRPIWRTVDGGSRAYVERLAQPFANRIAVGRRIRTLRRRQDAVDIIDDRGDKEVFDHVVIATHADQALAVLSDPSADECRLLGAFGYNENLAVLHSDPAWMPKRRRAWASWNYISRQAGASNDVSVTYWLNRLQGLPGRPLFVTLNPQGEPRLDLVIHREVYHHPRFDTAAMAAQKELWSLQGKRNTWYCGAYFGAGFHEDGLQSGLAVAEALGGVKRPWTVAGESDRIFLYPATEMAPGQRVA